MKTKTFAEFKKKFSAACRNASACEGEFRKLLASKNWQELFLVIKNNARWCHTSKVISTEILAQCPDKELVKANIYVNKKEITQTTGTCYYFSSTSKHYGSSTSEHYDSSTSKHYDSSTSEHYDSSTSKHYDSSTSEHYGSSTSEHYDSSTSKHYDSSRSEHYGSSFGSVYEFSKGHSTIDGDVIIRERSSSKIYLSNKKLEIVYT